MSVGFKKSRSKLIRNFSGEDLPPFAVRRFTVEEYHRLIAAGILQDGDPYELLDGWITKKMTKNPPHEVCLRLLHSVLGQQTPLGWMYDSQLAIKLSHSVPEPDGMIVRGSPRDFITEHPGPHDVALVIEVADLSLDRDRLKAQFYAQAKISRYWLINLPERVIEDFSQPMGIGKKAKYKQVKKHGEKDTISITLGRKSIQVPVRDVLP